MLKRKKRTIFSHDLDSTLSVTETSHGILRGRRYLNCRMNQCSIMHTVYITKKVSCKKDLEKYIKMMASGKLGYKCFSHPSLLFAVFFYYIYISSIFSQVSKMHISFLTGKIYPSIF